ncbi:MAG: V-type ATP synthase subunit E [Clostridiales bacterium]|nr:V-type ATP synthase subunit E [Clostridiales bacterium]
MTGLDKIVDQILAEAKTEADRIIDQAQTQAKTIADESDAATEKSVRAIRAKADADVKNLDERMHSANDLYSRTATLAAKQAMIAKVIDLAYEKICSMDRKSYFGMLEKMIRKYALAQPGEICFSKADLDAMPLGYQMKIKAAAAEAGGSLTVSDTGRDIENGFILVYGGIEENCTIKAIFDASRDEMQDTVHALLYGKEA